MMVRQEYNDIIHTTMANNFIQFPKDVHSPKSLGVVEVIPDGEALPEVADREDGKVILHNGHLYQRRTAGTQVGLSFTSHHTTFGGDATYGYYHNNFGVSLINPNGRIVAFYVQAGILNIIINREAYRTEKGSNEATGDTLAVTVTTNETTARTATVNAVYRGVGVGTDLLFSAVAGSIPLDNASVNHTIEVGFVRNNQPFFQVSSTMHTEWSPLVLEQAKELGSQIRHLAREDVSIINKDTFLPVPQQYLYFNATVDRNAYNAENETHAIEELEHEVRIDQIQSIQLHMVGARFGTTSGGINNQANIDLSKYEDGTIYSLPPIHNEFIHGALDNVVASSFTNSSQIQLTTAALNGIAASTGIVVRVPTTISGTPLQYLGNRLPSSSIGNNALVRFVFLTREGTYLTHLLIFPAILRSGDYGSGGSVILPRLRAIDVRFKKQ